MTDWSPCRHVSNSRGIGARGTNRWNRSGILQARNDSSLWVSRSTEEPTAAFWYTM